MKRDALKSASTAIGQQPITLDVLKEKYLKDGETSEQDIYRRVARALASVEPEADRALWEQRFFDNLQAGAIGAGRIAGAQTLYSPFVIVLSLAFLGERLSLLQFVGVALLVGVWRGRALLQILLEAAFEGLNQQGWLKLSRNWGVFFLFLAVLNEILRAQMSFEGWLWAKLWVFLPLTFLFTFSQIPMLLKHGLSFEDKDDLFKDEPPTGG